MNATTWIIVAVLAVVLLAILAVVVGLKLRASRRISLTSEEKKAPTQLERSGDYQASSGFSFTPAGTGSVSQSVPSEAVAPPEVRSAPTVSSEGKISGEAPTAVSVPGTATEPDFVDAAPADSAPVYIPEGDLQAPSSVRTGSDATSAVETSAVETSAVVTGADQTRAPAATPETTDRIDPAEGRLERLRGRLARSQSSVGQGLLGLLGAGDLDEEAWEEIEDMLIMADLGTATTQTVVDRLRTEIASRSVRTEAEVRGLLRQVLIDALHPEMPRSIAALPQDGIPAVLLVVGVNGTGKTTTTGKLARVLVSQGHRILLGAADTFRAAAADQLQTWGERVGADVVRGREQADPASVAFDAVNKGIEAGVDAVLVDTAGRLHTKTGLMDELGKVKRVVEKKSTVDEVLLVIDATTGQNGLLQARVFKEVVSITGVVLTKLDGTAKGGIVFQVQHELGVPVKLVGLGEGPDDLAPFTPEAFVDALLG